MKIISILLLSISTLFSAPFPTSDWVLFSWASSGAYKPSAAFGVGGDVSTFQFPLAKRNNPFPAFLTTTIDTNLLGDLTGKTIVATINLAVTGDPIFAYGGNTPWSSWNQGGLPANVRLFISSYPGTYDLQYATFHESEFWWSSGPSAWAVISASTGTVTLTDTFDLSHWSNANGHSAADPNYTAAFQAAVANVRQIGASFGGGSFFDVGVSVLPNTGTAILHLQSYVVQ